jgi:hypothetical protein
MPGAASLAPEAGCCACARRARGPGGDSPALLQALARLYQAQGRFDLALAILLRLRQPAAFDFVAQHALLHLLRPSHVAALVRIDEVILYCPRLFLLLPPYGHALIFQSHACAADATTSLSTHACPRCMLLQLLRGHNATHKCAAGARDPAAGGPARGGGALHSSACPGGERSPCSSPTCP